MKSKTAERYNIDWESFTSLERVKYAHPEEYRSACAELIMIGVLSTNKSGNCEIVYEDGLTYPSLDGAGLYFRTRRSALRYANILFGEENSSTWTLQKYHEVLSGDRANKKYPEPEEEHVLHHV